MINDKIKTFSDVFLNFADYRKLIDIAAQGKEIEFMYGNAFVKGVLAGVGNVVHKKDGNFLVKTITLENPTITDFKDVIEQKPMSYPSLHEHITPVNEKNKRKLTIFKRDPEHMEYRAEVARVKQDIKDAKRKLKLENLKDRLSLLKEQLKE